MQPNGGVQLKMSKPQYFTGKYFVWKLEDKTVTIQAKSSPVIPSLKEFFVDNKAWLLQKLKEWKEQGFAAVEFWVPPECYPTSNSFFKTAKFKLEVVRTEKDGSRFCRLLL